MLVTAIPATALSDSTQNWTESHWLIAAIFSGATSTLLSSQE
jgi:hypothetical protein